MQTSNLTNLCSQIKPINEELALLKFWREYPEIKSIEVTCTYEYDDMGAYFPSFYVENIKFVSDEAKQNLAQKLFPEEEPDDLDYNSDWDQKIEFTQIGLEPISEVYERPEDLDAEVTRLQTIANDTQIDFLKGHEVYAVVDPAWLYNDEYFYVEEGEKVANIYASAEAAEAAAKKANLFTVELIRSSEIDSEDLFDGTESDECETPEQKLELWKMYAPQFLASVRSYTIQ